MNNLIKTYNLDEDNSIIVGKRINRFYPTFWCKETDTIDPTLFENVEETITLLDSKFSNPTIITTLEFILKVFEYYVPCDETFKKYEDHLSDYYSIENAPQSFEKITIPCLSEFIHSKAEDYLRGHQNFTKMRNFVLLSLMIFTIPFKLHTLMNIEFMGYEGIDFHDSINKKIVLMYKQRKFYLIFNKGSIANQVILPIENNILHRLLRTYIVKYKNNNNYLFSTAQGRPLSKSNLSNGIVNYTRKEFGFSLTIYDIRKIWFKNYKHLLTNEQKYLYKF